MPPQTHEHADEIAFFIIEGTHRLAVISMNDYGFLLSSRMAQTYLDRAMHVLETKQGFDRAVFTEVSRLKATGQAIAREYAQFEKFCRDCEALTIGKPATGASGSPNGPFAPSPEATGERSATTWPTRSATFIPWSVRS